MSKIVDKNLSTIDIESLSDFINLHFYPNIPLSRVREIKNKLHKIPNIVYGLDSYHDSRRRGLIRNVKTTLARRKFINEEKLTDGEIEIVEHSMFDHFSLNLHYFLFSLSVMLQANEAQKSEWMPKIDSLEVIGCYAQTELGHGSNVRGIETEAVYDHSTKEFIINTPNKSSYKWWIGSLGVVSNHALLVAQLKINGQAYGPHPFMVPIRDLKTNEPLPGIDVGDIGPKMGANFLDNGFIGFKNVRIPKKNMLNRYSRINEDGNYELLESKSIKILFLTLLKGRVEIIRGACFPLSIALTIAIRYSNYRRQFTDINNPTEETKIINYQIQQYKLFKPLAFLYGIIFSKEYINQLYIKAENEVSIEQSEALKISHGISSLFKTFVTQNTLNYIELCRKSCGGHGYLTVSGFHHLYTGYVPSITFEGENSILALQAIKVIVSMNNQKSDNPFSFLFKSKITPQGNPLSSEFQQQCFEAIAQYKMELLLKKIKILTTKGHSKDKIWNDFLQVEGIETAESIFHCIFNNCYINAISKYDNHNNRELLQQLKLIYVANELEQYKGELLVNGVTMDSLIVIKQESLNALEIVKNNALELIEAFEIKDATLNSVLGSKDKDVYEALLDSSKNLNKINKKKVFPGIKDILKPKI